METYKIPEYFKDQDDARQKARETLTKTFQNKMINLDNIKTIINEFRRLENQNSIEVFNRIERSIDESEISTNKISSIIENISEIEKSLTLTSKNWEEITRTLNFYGKNLEKLMLSKKNVSSLIHNLNMYVKIQDQVKELQILMEKEENIVYIYKNVRYLTYLREILLDKVKSVSRTDKLNNLADHLLCVEKFSDEFFNKFWKHFANTIDLSIKKPEFLVKLLRLVEEDADYMKALKNQFSIYNKYDEKYIGIEKNNFQKQFTMYTGERESNLKQNEGCDSEKISDILLQKINYFIDERIHELFFNKVELSEITEISISLMNELSLVQTKVIPCFPPKYDIFNVYCKKYLHYIHEKLKPFMTDNELEKTPGLGILLASFLDKFETALQKVGVNIYESEIKSDITFSMHYFYEHTNTVLTECFERIITIDKANKQEIRDKKMPLNKISSTYAQDIFSVLYNEINLLAGDIKGEILYQIIKFALEKLTYIQQIQLKTIDNLYLADDLIVVCVYINDADSSINVMGEFKKFVKDKLVKEFHKWVKTFINNANNLFNSTIRTGCKKLIELMFVEIEIQLLRKLFTSEWVPDLAVGIFETFKNFYNTLFVKFIRNENILVIVVRTFIDCYVYYYIEEILHTVRSLMKKKITDFHLYKYELKYLKCYTMDEKENKIIYPHQFKSDNIDLKFGKVINLDNKEVKDVRSNTVDKKKTKYNFPVKKMEKSEKKINPIQFCDKFQKDIKSFETFLNSFKEDSKNPFSKTNPIVLGQNFLNTYLNKFYGMLKILKCSDKAINDEVSGPFKESFTGLEGKVLLEALICLREDSKTMMKNADTKKLLLQLYESKKN